MSKFFILKENGAYSEENGIYYGEKGQILRSRNDNPPFDNFVILSPKEEQTKTEFYVGEEKIRPL
jgi:hypothetical protein